ncbi:transmembrane protein, putative (macronuclear) [Tetrahymena thermophila SB210]|uniref:Transmembrane protein, putative n=1 Tax=Tetrahymena thermophila (strain SB210) TaxID=312017 RepID=Q22MB1_TETTS|nr:transmembrane protein, putative [Tetrahymena thermophila SB210]EAR86465.2 transmembrane protein, putative [Tetrahymena thermophila SB210]|eukprot:XP_977109.2 transmembrane protein, putative [Tetrahymena thermophila SB210]
MPPRKKKVDPEVQRQQFEQWKASPEYEQIKKIATLLETYDYITETTKDFTGPWYLYLNELVGFFKLYKVKLGKLKEFKHEHIRSFFFGREDKETEKIIIDGIRCGVTKEHADRSYFCRHKFIETMKYIKDIDDLDPETFQKAKKEVIKIMKEFVKFFTPHIKYGHPEIYDLKIAKVLEPLTNLIDINNQYRQFMITYKPEVEKEVRDFMSRVIVKKYINHLQEVFRVLYEESIKPNISCLPDCKRLFYKIHIYGWEKNPVESKYLKPLNDCFLKMQKCLIEMKIYGINYWRIPLHSNEKLMKCIELLINADLIAEKIIGNPLKRDQLNFFYNIIGLIYKSDEKIRENLLKKDENITKLAIPQLIIFKQIQHILSWKFAKKEREEKIRIQSEKLSILNKIKEEERANSPLKKRMEEKKVMEETTVSLKSKMNITSPQKTTSPVKKDDKQEEEPLPAEYKLLEGDEAIYGRYWYLENLIGEDVREEIEECVEMLRHINEAVQQDIEDSYIKQNFNLYESVNSFKIQKILTILEVFFLIYQFIYLIGRIGLTQKQKRGDKKDKNETPYYLELSERENSNIRMNIVRPPELWNYPEILKEHKFRSIANPNKCYDDHRVDGLDKKIIELAQKLNNYRRFTWTEIISRIIDVYSGEENLLPTKIDPREDPTWFEPDPTPHEIEVQRKREELIKLQQINAAQALQQQGGGTDQPEGEAQ